MRPDRKMVAADRRLACAASLDSGIVLSASENMDRLFTRERWREDLRLFCVAYACFFLMIVMIFGWG